MHSGLSFLMEDQVLSCDPLAQSIYLVARLRSIDSLQVILKNVDSINMREVLVIINGTVGVGKTSIAKSLASEIADAVFIEGDNLGFASPENDYVLKAGIKLISEHRKKGARLIIFDLFFDNLEKLEWFISQVGIESYVIYLSANETELSNRIRNRARARAESEILDSKRMKQNQDRMPNRGIEIDTNGKNTDEITSIIKKLIFANR